MFLQTQRFAQLTLDAITLYCFSKITRTYSHSRKQGACALKIAFKAVVQHKAGNGNALACAKKQIDLLPALEPLSFAKTVFALRHLHLK